MESALSGKARRTRSRKGDTEKEKWDRAKRTMWCHNPQLAVKTGFSDADAETIKNLLPRLFENDASSARPEGSMAVAKVLWWEHNCRAGQFSSAKVHGSLTVNPDGTYALANLPELRPEEIDGF